MNRDVPTGGSMCGDACQVISGVAKSERPRLESVLTEVKFVIWRTSLYPRPKTLQNCEMKMAEPSLYPELGYIQIRFRADFTGVLLVRRTWSRRTSSSRDRRPPRSRGGRLSQTKDRRGTGRSKSAFSKRERWSVSFGVAQSSAARPGGQATRPASDSWCRGTYRSWRVLHQDRSSATHASRDGKGRTASRMDQSPDPAILAILVAPPGRDLTSMTTPPPSPPPPPQDCTRITSTNQTVVLVRSIADGPWLPTRVSRQTFVQVVYRSEFSIVLLRKVGFASRFSLRQRERGKRVCVAPRHEHHRIQPRRNRTVLVR